MKKIARNWTHACIYVRRTDELAIRKKATRLGLSISQLFVRGALNFEGERSEDVNNEQ